MYLRACSSHKAFLDAVWHCEVRRELMYGLKRVYFFLGSVNHAVRFFFCLSHGRTRLFSRLDTELLPSGVFHVFIFFLQLRSIQPVKRQRECVVGRKETATGVVNSVVVDVVAELSCVCVCVVYVCLHITWLRFFFFLKKKGKRKRKLEKSV